MNIGGFSGDNTHNGDTQIFGSLTVDGQVIVRDAEGQSEYLASGNYNPVVLGVPTHWNSLILKSGTQARYAKNGNIVEVYMELTGSLKANQAFAQISVSVPSVDLFDKKHIGSAYSDSVFILASGAQVYNCTAANITTSGFGDTSVLLNYDSYIATNPASVVDFFLNITYKLEGDDIPASAIIQGGGGSGGDVRNPMIEPLNGGGFNILNVGNIQASTFNGGAILNNPLSVDLNTNNKNINNVNDLSAELIEVKNLYAKSPNVAINVFTDLVFDENNIYQLSSITNAFVAFAINSALITLNGSTTCGGDIDMDSNKLTRAGEITTVILQTDIIRNPTLGSPVIFNSEIETNNLPINLNGSFIDNCSVISNTSNIDIKTVSSPIKIAPTTSGNVELSTPNGQAKVQGSIINFVSGGTIETISSIQKLTLCNRIEHSASPAVKIDTVHIFATSGFTEPQSTISGFDYYTLKDNCTYVIHDQITVTRGFNFGINSVIKGASSAASITFDESTKNIVGFRAVDQNLIVQDITIIGGGGHFDNNINVGLFQGSNFDTGGLAPFYGRNKRCLISGNNIVAPFNLGKLQGFGTTNILSNFINGGGAVASSIYTTIGLDVSDGLSFELRGNKLVLFKGATGVSTLKMINFVDSTLTPVILGINAVIISGNILHPRDNENAINFETNAIVSLGTIGSNTFIRTGGTAPLINYDKATIYDNYNHPSIQNFEIVGNAGVVNSQPVLTALIGASGSMNSATFTDIDYTITDMNPLSSTKRFAYKLVMTTLTGTYTAGNYLKQSVGNNKGLIAKADPVVLGTQAIYIADADQLSGTSFVEVDVSDVATGTSSTSLQLGTNSNNFEFIYLEKDEENVQFVLGINFINDTKEDEIQFRLEFDETGTGNSFVGTANSTISALLAKDGRTASATLPFIKRMKNGDLVKLTYRYVDNTNTTVQSVIWTAK